MYACIVGLNVKKFEYIVGYSFESENLLHIFSVVVNIEIVLVIYETSEAEFKIMSKAN